MLPQLQAISDTSPKSGLPYEPVQRFFQLAALVHTNQIALKYSSLVARCFVEATIIFKIETPISLNNPSWVIR